MKIKLVAEIEGKTEVDIEYGLAEITRLVLGGYVEGGDGCDDRQYHFTATREEK